MLLWCLLTVHLPHGLRGAVQTNTSPFMGQAAANSTKPTTVPSTLHPRIPSATQQPHSVIPVVSSFPFSPLTVRAVTAPPPSTLPQDPCLNNNCSPAGTAQTTADPTQGCLCKCNPRWAGPQCSECEAPWAGPQCSECRFGFTPDPILKSCIQLGSLAPTTEAATTLDPLRNTLPPTGAPPGASSLSLTQTLAIAGGGGAFLLLVVAGVALAIHHRKHTYGAAYDPDYLRMYGSDPRAGPPSIASSHSANA